MVSQIEEDLLMVMNDMWSSSTEFNSIYLI